MDSWIFWLIAGCVLGAGEMLGMDFFLAPFAVGAFAGALVAVVGAGGTAATIVFAVATALTFGLVRPIARRHLRMPPELRTGTAALVGRTAVVLERIANHEGVGAVRIESEVWTARAYDEDQVFEAGARVQVVEIKGATALVSE
jgi:membrane protein implicated in regulation of membrane protease activity